MSFSFDFGNDEASDDEDNHLTKSTQSLSLDSAATAENQAPAAPTQQHDLHSLLDAMPLSLAYSTIDISGTRLRRRALWDIKHQLMSDEGEEAQAENVLNLMSSDDVIKGVYEGGFKTWECSIDLVTYLAQSYTVTDQVSILELGCGSALPSLQIFQQALLANCRIRLVVQDYNLPVLQYSTVPNLFLIWLSTRESIEHAEDEGEVNVTDELKEEFLNDLQKRGVTIECFSGSWSQELCEATGQIDLILASETIYERRNLTAFTQVLQKCLKQDGIALVAAKCVYFGVGGGVDEFTKESQRHNVTCNRVYDCQAGVKRTILQLQHK